jgi:hypothetical protein
VNHNKNRRHIINKETNSVKVLPFNEANALVETGEWIWKTKEKAKTTFVKHNSTNQPRKVTIESSKILVDSGEYTIIDNKTFYKLYYESYSKPKRVEQRKNQLSWGNNLHCLDDIFG